jgi:hypothetical protein
MIITYKRIKSCDALFFFLSVFSHNDEFYPRKFFNEVVFTQLLNL